MEKERNELLNGLSEEKIKRSTIEHELKLFGEKAQSDALEAHTAMRRLENDISISVASKEKVVEKFDKYRTSMTKNLLIANAHIASLNFQIRGKEGAHQETLSKLQWTEKEREKLVFRAAQLQLSLSEARSEYCCLEMKVETLESSLLSTRGTISSLTRKLERNS